jgi:hypothetical protein
MTSPPKVPLTGDTRFITGSACKTIISKDYDARIIISLYSEENDAILKYLVAQEFFCFAQWNRYSLTRRNDARRGKGNPG